MCIRQISPVGSRSSFRRLAYRTRHARRTVMARHARVKEHWEERRQHLVQVVQQQLWTPDTRLRRGWARWKSASGGRRPCHRVTRRRHVYEPRTVRTPRARRTTRASACNVF